MSGSMDRRVDQGSQPPVSVVPPTQAAGLLRARTVILFGTGVNVGLFVYTGTPALGNPPQIAIVPNTTTTDLFGNAVTSSKILMQANVITETGGIFRTAATAPLIQLDGPHDALLNYDAAAALINTISPAAGNDGLGNSFRAGIGSYTATQIANLFSGGLAMALRGATPTTVDATMQPQTNGSGLALTVISGAISTDTASTLFLGDSAATNAGLQVVDGRDGNTYNTEHLIQRTTATQQFTLASAVAITSLSVALGVGSYHVSLKVFWVPSGVVGSTHVHKFAFTGTATGNVNGQCWQAQAASAVQQTALNAGAGNNLTASLTSPTHVAFAGWTELEADITVTVAGTLTHTIMLTTAGDDITTSAGTFWEVKPL